MPDAIVGVAILLLLRRGPLPAQPEALVDLVGPIEARIVDEPLV